MKKCPSCSNKCADLAVQCPTCKALLFSVEEFTQTQNAPASNPYNASSNMLFPMGYDDGSSAAMDASYEYEEYYEDDSQENNQDYNQNYNPNQQDHSQYFVQQPNFDDIGEFSSTPEDLYLGSAQGVPNNMNNTYVEDDNQGWLSNNQQYQGENYQQQSEYDNQQQYYNQDEYTHEQIAHEQFENQEQLAQEQPSKSIFANNNSQPKKANDARVRSILAGMKTLKSNIKEPQAEETTDDLFIGQVQDIYNNNREISPQMVEDEIDAFSMPYFSDKKPNQILEADGFDDEQGAQFAQQPEVAQEEEFQPNKNILKMPVKQAFSKIKDITTGQDDDFISEEADDEVREYLIHDDLYDEFSYVEGDQPLTEEEEARRQYEFYQKYKQQNPEMRKYKSKDFKWWHLAIVVGAILVVSVIAIFIFALN